MLLALLVRQVRQALLILPALLALLALLVLLAILVLLVPQTERNSQWGPGFELERASLSVPGCPSCGFSVFLAVAAGKHHFVNRLEIRPL